MATSRPIEGHLMKSSGTSSLIFSKGQFICRFHSQRITYPVDHTAHAMMASRGMSVVQVKHSPRRLFFFTGCNIIKKKLLNFTIKWCSRWFFHMATIILDDLQLLINTVQFSFLWWCISWPIDFNLHHCGKTSVFLHANWSDVIQGRGWILILSYSISGHIFM